MAATLLLESPSSVKVFALERELGIGTSAVRAELDAPTFGKVSDDIRSTLQRNPGSKLWISWRVEKKG